MCFPHFPPVNLNTTTVSNHTDAVISVMVEIPTRHASWKFTTVASRTTKQRQNILLIFRKKPSVLMPPTPKKRDKSKLVHPCYDPLVGNTNHLSVAVFKAHTCFK